MIFGGKFDCRNVFLVIEGYYLVSKKLFRKLLGDRMILMIKLCKNYKFRKEWRILWVCDL